MSDRDNGPGWRSGEEVRVQAAPTLIPWLSALSQAFRAFLRDSPFALLRIAFSGASLKVAFTIKVKGNGFPEVCRGPDLVSGQANAMIFVRNLIAFMTALISSDSKAMAGIAFSMSCQALDVIADSKTNHFQPVVNNFSVGVDERHGKGNKRGFAKNRWRCAT
jgi:hypothetical protein